MEQGYIETLPDGRKCEFRVKGIHIEYQMEGSERVYSEYDLLAIISEKDNIDDFWSALHKLDMIVPPDNRTYYVLRGSVIFDRLSFIKKEMDEKKVGEIKTYLMSDSNTGFTKIGVSRSPHIRERTLQSEKPTISLLKICDALVERELHRKYKGKRVRGEWFNLSENDLEAIISEYNFHDCQM